MNIVYLIGNGFDRNLDLHTDYPSFYNYYMTQNLSSPVITTLINEIHSDYKNWADLEEALGKYLQNIVNEEDAKAIHKDLLEHLQEYICKENNRFNPQNTRRSDFFTELFTPIKSLRRNQREN